MSNLTTLQVCTYNEQTHVYTSVFDLNDRVTTFLVTTHLDQPKKVQVRNFNIRTPGQPISRFQYQNRHVQLSVNLHGASTTALLTTIRSLLSAIEKPPYFLRIMLPQGTQYSYIQVRAIAHNIPTETMPLLAGVIRQVQLDFECAPFFAGDWQTLQNLVANPGFEATGNISPTVFNDNYATINAYTTVSGSAPTVSANAMTVAVNSIITFGSQAWGPFASWTFRFQYQTNLNLSAFYHFNSPGNYIMATMNNNALSIVSVTGNVSTTLLTAGFSSFSAGGYYWAVLRHMPNESQLPQNLHLEIYGDSSGVMGAQIAQITGVTSANASWLTGPMGFAPGGVGVVLGGVASNDSVVTLFGPAPWSYNSAGTGWASGVWDRSYSNNYQGGPVNSLGAARVDFCAQGTAEGYWRSWNNTSAATVKQTASPCQGSTTYSFSAWTRSTGLSAGAKTYLLIYWFDNTGTVISGAYEVTLTGNNTYWTQMTGTITTASNAAYLGMILMAYDGTAGASANASIWFDNAQIWLTSLNAAMPYCETTFETAPATMVLSGLLGDVPAPTLLSIGTLPNGGSIAANHSISAYIGRKSAISNNMPMVCSAQSGSLNGGTIAQIVDATASNNVTLQYRTVGAVPMTVQGTAGDVVGVYHLFARIRMYDSTFATQTAQITIYETPNLWSGDMTQVRGYAQSPVITPWTGNLMQVIDCGLLTLPPFAKATEANLSGIYETPFIAIPNTTNGVDVDWLALVPVDTEIAIAQFSTAGMSVSLTGWVWLYFDGTWQMQGQGSSISWSLETAAAPDVALAGGGPGAATGSVPIPNGDGGVWVDPSISSGVNQFVVVLTDDLANVLPLATQVEYQPLYLYPR